MKKIFQSITLLASFGAPFFASAQTGVNVSYLQNYSNGITSVINYILVPVLMAIAFIVFLWGVYKYFILGAADEKSRTDGRQFTLWGVIGFVVILSLWGIVNIFMSTLGLSVGSAPPYPTIGNVGGVQNTTGGSIFTNSPAIGGTSGTISPAQTAALTQQYNSMQTVCNASGTLSDQCKSAEAAYLQNYNAAYPSTASYNTCISNGGDPAVCQCEAGGGVWNLTDNVCSSNSGQSSGGQASPYQTCINNGGDPAVCTCESQGGVWSLTDSSCSTGGTTQSSGGTTPSAYQSCLDGGNDPAVCQCEADGGAWSTTDSTCSI